MDKESTEQCEHIFIGRDMLCRLCGIYFPEREED